MKKKVLHLDRISWILTIAGTIFIFFFCKGMNKYAIDVDVFKTWHIIVFTILTFFIHFFFFNYYDKKIK